MIKPLNIEKMESSALDFLRLNIFLYSKIVNWLFDYKMILIHLLVAASYVIFNSKNFEI